MIRLIEITDKTYRKGTGTMKENRYELNKQLAQMLKGGVIMDVTTPEQAKIAEELGIDKDNIFLLSSGDDPNVAEKPVGKYDITEIIERQDQR